MRKIIRKFMGKAAPKPPPYNPAIPDDVWSAHFRAWAPVQERTDSTLPVWMASYQHWSEPPL